MLGMLPDLVNPAPGPWLGSCGKERPLFPNQTKKQQHNWRIECIAETMELHVWK
jgi:hypothetical protein